MKRLRIVGIVTAGILMTAVVSFFTWLAPVVAGAMNRAEERGPFAVTPDAERLHASLRIVDLHADLLLWPRDPLRRSRRGHTDIPRLLDGNVALQVFSAVTKVPFGMNYESNSGSSDQLVVLAMASRWPLRTWRSPLQRALHQARRLEDAARRSQGQLVMVRSRDDLNAFVIDRASGTTGVAALLALEGMHAFEGRMEGVDALLQAGYRMAGFTHFFDNEVAGSAHGEGRGGLTEFGRRVIVRLESEGVVLDLAHASPVTISEVLALATNPVVVSHTGVQGTCAGPRNLSDEQILAIGENGGVIGIGFWRGAVCATDPAAIVKAMVYVRDLIGIEHVALGSDFDGSVWTAFDATGLPLITEAMLEAGFSDDDVRAAMGENAMRVLGEVLK